MTDIKNETLSTLRIGIPVRTKSILLKRVLSTSEDNKELLAILTIAEYHNWTTGRLRSLRNKLKLMPINLNFEDVNLIFKKIVTKEEITNIVSEESFEIISYLLSPLAFGLIPKSLRDVLSSYQMTYHEALTILDLFIKEEEVEEVKPCGACGRIMKSTGNTSGLCSSCISIALSYTYFRRGTFRVPLNTFNFPRFESFNDTKVDYTILDYNFSKEGDDLVFKNIKDFNGIFEFPLPIEEYAKEIHIL